MASTNEPDPYPCATLTTVGELPMDKHVLYRSLPTKIKEMIKNSFNVYTEEQFFNKMKIGGTKNTLEEYDKFNTGPIITAFISINNSICVRDKPKRIRPTRTFHPKYSDVPDDIISNSKRKERLHFYQKFIIEPHRVLTQYFEMKRILILQVNNEPTNELFVLQLPHTHLISELFANKNNDHTRAVTQILEDAATTREEYNNTKRKMWKLESTQSVPQNIIQSTLKDIQSAPPELKDFKRLVNKYTKKYKSYFSRVGPHHHLAIMSMPSSHENIPLGEGQQGVYDTQVLRQIIINALTEQIGSRMKIQCCSEFIGRMYFLQTINGERSQKPHVDSRFNPTTNRDRNCTESSWSVDIPITPLGMELNIWPRDASPTNVCKAIRLKIKLGQFIMRSPKVIHGGSYNGLRVHMAVATNRNQQPDIDNKAQRIVTDDVNNIDFSAYCIPREPEGW